MIPDRPVGVEWSEPQSVSDIRPVRPYPDLFGDFPAHLFAAPTRWRRFMLWLRRTFR